MHKFILCLSSWVQYNFLFLPIPLNCSLLCHQDWPYHWIVWGSFLRYPIMRAREWQQGAGGQRCVCSLAWPALPKLVCCSLWKHNAPSPVLEIRSSYQCPWIQAAKYLRLVLHAISQTTFIISLIFKRTLPCDMESCCSRTTNPKALFMSNLGHGSLELS